MLRGIVTFLTIIVPVMVAASSAYLSLEKRAAVNSRAIDDLAARQELTEGYLQKQLDDIRKSLHRMEDKLDRLRTDK